jgi:hypothetical protein
MTQENATWSRRRIAAESPTKGSREVLPSLAIALRGCPRARAVRRPSSDGHCIRNTGRFRYSCVAVPASTRTMAGNVLPPGVVAITV